MDPLSTPKPDPAQTPPPPSQGGPIFDPMQQNQNYDTTSPVGGVQTTTSFAQPQPFQPRGQQSTPNCCCCCCEPRVCLGVFAGFEVAAQLAILIVFFLEALDYVGHGGRGGGRQCPTVKLQCDTFFVAVLFFIVLALTSSIVLLTSTCMNKKTLSVVSHVVGWIPILSAVIYASVFVHYIFRGGTLLGVGLPVGIGLLWRIGESFVVCRYWKEIPGQYASRNQGQAKNTSAYGQTNYDYATRGYAGYGNGYTPSAAQPDYGYAQPGYGAYGQPGGYNYGGGGYGGFGQPGYGGYAGYGGFGQPVGSYSHV